MRWNIIIGCIFALVGLALGIPAPTLNLLPDYTKGTTCELSWSLPPSAAIDPTIAFHIQVVDADGIPVFPDLVDPIYSIFPIPTSSAPGNKYTIGLNLDASPADDALRSGVRYCYRIQYRQRVSGRIWVFSDWSRYTCSRQDNTPPTVAIDTLNRWTNVVRKDVFFKTEDAIVSDVRKIHIYFRTDSMSTWTLYGDEPLPGGSPISSSVSFNSASVGGDGYYEFFLAGEDRLGNTIDPNSVPGGLADMQTWTRFDTEKPWSNIETSGLLTYYTVPYCSLFFDGGDLYSGVDIIKLLYKKDFGLITEYTVREYFGALNINDSLLFSPVSDGHYEIFLQAIDSAENIEDALAPKATINIDTRDPEFNRVTSTDTTLTPHPTDVPAEGGYTNSVNIWVDPFNATDPPRFGDVYASGVESVYVSEGPTFLDNLQVFKYLPVVHYLYIMNPGDGLREFYVKLKDFAGNYSTSKIGNIILDTNPPSLRSVTILDLSTRLPFDSTDVENVLINIVPEPGSTPFYKMYLTQNYADLANIPDAEWRDFDDTVSFGFSGFSEGDWMHIWVVVKDSAGNISNAAHDSICYNPFNGIVELISIKDINGPDLTGTYTDSTRVNVTVSYNDDIHYVILNDGLIEVRYDVEPLPPGEDTTIVHVFSEGDGERCIIARGYSEYGPFTDPDTRCIILDTRNPILDDFKVLDISTGFNASDTSEIADTHYTNKANVKAIFSAYDRAIPGFPDGTGIFMRKIQVDALEIIDPWNFAEPLNFDLPGSDGSYRVNGFVQDSAGNWSLEKYFEITLDTKRPEISLVTLRDLNSGSSDQTDSLTVIVETDATDDPYIPAYIAFFENPGHWPGDLSTRWRKFNSTGIDTYTFLEEPGDTKTLYIAVKDNAGNISLMANASIRYSKEISASMTLYDLDRPRITQYTNSTIVGIKFDVTGQTGESYYLAMDTMPIPPEDPRWIEYLHGTDVTHTLPAGDGIKVVYGWIRSVAHTVSPMFKDSIILDQTLPDIPEGFTVWDTTSFEMWPNIWKAHMGWANEREIYASIPLATDELSGVDSLHFLGPFASTLWDPGRSYLPIDSGIVVRYPNDSIELIIDTTEAAFRIIGGAMDGAGNWRNSVVNGGYDITPPNFSFNPLEFYDTTRFPDTIPMYIVEPHLWKVCFHVAEIDTKLCSVYNRSWDVGEDDYNVFFPLADLLDPGILYKIGVVVVDSAGNASIVDSLKIWNKFDFKVVAPNDTLDSEFTNSKSVITVINTVDEPDSMRFAESKEALHSRSWIKFSRTSEFEFASLVNEIKNVFCQVKYRSYKSPVNHDDIILDTITPTMEKIEARDEDSGDPNWSDKSDVQITIFDPEDTYPGLVYALMVDESPDFDYNVQILQFSPDNPVVLYHAADEPYYPVGAVLSDEHMDALREGARLLYAQVLDRAENPSETRTYKIIIDPSDKEVINFPNPFDPSTNEITHIMLKAKEMGAIIKIEIYDMFGNLVWTGEKHLKSDSRAGEIIWKGENDEGEVVANGGYIAVVDFGDKVVMRKIAVWKGIERE